MKDNELIAEFWGMELGDDKTMYYDDAENLHPPTPVNELQFHTSWDWLMPVVEKIYSLDADIDFFRVVNLEATYKAVVEFIKEYNNED